VQNLSTKPDRQGVEILVRGTVQGVGFRPFIYNLAHRLGISGSVGNSPDGVVITAIAPHHLLNRFVRSIRAEAPPLARISSIESRPMGAAVAREGFSIQLSAAGGEASTAIPPDIALCEECRRELFNPADRRYRYPFINCTNCGPRLSIIETIPYDRPKTSMKVFPMCPACMAEYHNPGNRRFHAQPNACPECGPLISLHERSGAPLGGSDPIALAVAALARGEILAMRGMGGFHLIVDGTSPTAVARLRQRKGRPDKPLAVMAADLDKVKHLCRLSLEEGRLLSSPAHPIVLLQPRRGVSLAENLNPGIGELGVMLPYTPLHHLLFQEANCPEVLVMTSGNASGAPICTANDDALSRLGHIADLFLLHNREIVTRVDDSVLRVIGDRPLILRRARGLAPEPLQVAWPLPRMLACGAGLKNTFCLSRGRTVYPSQHIGDLENQEIFTFFEQSINHFQKLFQLEPEAVAGDLHPDYLSSHYAASLGLPLYPVQHHHAHAVAVMAEHGLNGPVLAVVLDGTGLGDDQTIWGGEILEAGLTGYRRLGHLSHLSLPGGDVAAREPWRMALAALFAGGGEQALSRQSLPVTLTDLDRGKVAVIQEMLAKGFNCPPSSSCGRLFDAVAALLGVRRQNSYEGQAAMELEALAKRAAGANWRKAILPNAAPDPENYQRDAAGCREIRSTDLVSMIIDGVHKGMAPAGLALGFHTALIAQITGLVGLLAEETGIDQVVLAGGSMQNSLLLEGLFHTLADQQLQVYTGSQLPVNDGAVSFGQIIIGGLRHVSRNPHAGNPGRG
jgi:hydrogenase maturation protein HypF